MSKIYVPSFDNNNCVTIYDKDTIRVYETTPSYNNGVNYVDYFINSHYLEKTGIINFSNDDVLPTCIDNGNITNDFYYRHDISDILLVFFIILIICFLFPYKIISRMFGRWLKI